MINHTFVRSGHRLGTFFQESAFFFKKFFGKDIAIFVDKLDKFML